jgi:serine/threonine protein kinase
MSTERLNYSEKPSDETGSSSSPQEAEIGEVPGIGRYRGIRRVGEGGMAEVYLAHDDVLGRDVALKVLRRGPVDEQLVERFRREARNAASLSHSNIVSIYDWG